MATNFPHRLIVVVPANRCAALNAWIKNNVDPNGVNWFTPSLSGNGAAPATHAWASFATTEIDSDKFLDRLLMQAGLSRPGNWSNKNRTEKKQWIIDNRNEVKTKIGVWIVPMDNDGTWEDQEDALTAMGLKRVQHG